MFCNHTHEWSWHAPLQHFGPTHAPLNKCCQECTLKNLQCSNEMYWKVKMHTRRPLCSPFNGIKQYTEDNDIRPPIIFYPLQVTQSSAPIKEMCKFHWIGYIYFHCSCLYKNLKTFLTYMYLTEHMVLCMKPFYLRYQKGQIKWPTTTDPPAKREDNLINFSQWSGEVTGKKRTKLEQKGCNQGSI